MKKTPFRILRHAATMVSRTLRSYALLSVTIVLSFTLLLGYLLWTDSSLYNQYKEIFSKDRNIVTVFDQKLKTPSFAQGLREKAAEYGSVSSLQFDKAAFFQLSSRDGEIQLENGKILNEFQVYAMSVPAHAWSIYSGERRLEVTWLDGKEHKDYHLNSGEILIDERLYALFGLAEKDNQFPLSLGFYHDANGKLGTKPFQGRFTVVGTIASEEPLVFQDEGENANFVNLVYRICPIIAFPAADFNRGAYPYYEWTTPTVVFYSSQPEQVEALIRSTGIMANIRAPYADQNQALEAIQNEVGLKMIITVALLIILGINLYSSFANALNDRRFEVGVRRAIGASKWSILRQFLYESLLVMITNILLSVWLVLTIALTYKVVYENIPNKYGEFFTFTLTISSHSIGMFAACSLTLTVVFSFIFAYKTTQVQIVDYLKAE